MAIVVVYPACLVSSMLERVKYISHDTLANDSGTGA